jgi:aldehyde dehydrogenase (NAD+)
VVIKPAEDTPLSTIYLGRLAREAGIPDGVINVIPGTGQVTGAALSAHPGIRRMSFTGSPEVGRMVAESCGRNLVPVKLELGGKGAAVVFDDVDVAATAEKLVGAITFHTGQVCCDASRWIVHRSIHDRFLDECCRRLEQVRVGYQMDNASQMGPVVNAKQRARVLSYLEKGVKQGAKPVLAGGTADVSGRQGFYVKPALLAGPLDNVAAREEILDRSPTWRAFLARTKRSRWPTTPTTASPTASGPATSAGRRGSPSRWSPATAGSTPTTSSRAGCRTVA